MWLVVLGFMVIGLVSKFSLANLRLRVLPGGAMHYSAKTDSSEKDSGRLVVDMWFLLSPFMSSSSWW